MFLSNGSSDRQSDHRKAVGNPSDILFVLERLPSEMLGEGVFWINLCEFFPDSTSLITITEMTQMYGPAVRSKKILTRW